MAGSLNKVQLIGHLGKDPETRTFQDGGKVVNLRVATSETWRDKNNGELRERTEWHSVAVYNEALQKIAEQYMRKGELVYVEGQLENRKWQDQSGQDRYTTEVTVRSFRSALEMLGSKGGQGGNQGGSTQGGGYGNDGGYNGDFGQGGGQQARGGQQQRNTQSQGNRPQQRSGGQQGGYQQRTGGQEGGYQQGNPGNGPSYQSNAY